MSKTKNYALNIPSGQEKVSIMGGINPNFVKIDEELKNVDNKTITNKEEITKINTSLETLKKGVSSDTDTKIEQLKSENHSLSEQIKTIQATILNLQKTPTEPTKNVSHIGQIIFSTTLDTEEKVKNIYGGTSWKKIEDSFILGAINNSRETGGSNRVRLTENELPSHSHRITGLTGKTSRDGSHCHGENVAVDQGTGSGVRTDYVADAHGSVPFALGINTDYAGKHSHTVTINDGVTSETGSGSEFSVLNKYYSAYIWERTA